MSIKQKLKLIFGIVLTIIGAVLTLLSCMTLVGGYQSYSWVETEAEIVAAEMETRQESYRVKKGGPTRTYQTYDVKLRYRYSVSGKVFEGDRPMIGGHTLDTDLSNAEAKLEHYKVGSKINIYYDPEDPEQSAMKPGVNSSVYGGLLVGGFFLAIGLIVSLTSRREWTTKPPRI